MPPQQFETLEFRIRAELFAQLAVMEDAGLSYDRAMRTLDAGGRPELARRGHAAAQMVSKGTNLAEAGKRSGLFNAGLTTNTHDR